MKLFLLGLAVSAADLLPPIPIPSAPVFQSASVTAFANPPLQTMPVTVGLPQSLPIQTASLASNEVASLAQAQSILRQMSPSVRSMSQMSIQELRAFKFAHRAFVTEERLRAHALWHEQNGQGGAEGGGSGTAFLVMHRAMLLEFEAFVGGGFNIPQILPGELIPQELFVDPSTVALYGARAASTIIELSNPITTWGPELTNLDLFGRSMSDNHRLWHRQIGGVMLQLGESPLDPVFWLLHAYVDSLLDQWLWSVQGAQWTLQNPNHEIFRPFENAMTYTNERFARENTCLWQPTTLCTQLASADTANAQAVQTTTQPVFVSGSSFIRGGFGPMRGWQPPRGRLPRRGPRF